LRRRASRARGIVCARPALGPPLYIGERGAPYPSPKTAKGGAKGEAREAAAARWGQAG
jgi:hypothetical protein